jgi:hypothetical protein
MQSLINYHIESKLPSNAIMMMSALHFTSKLELIFLSFPERDLNNPHR